MDIKTMTSNMNSVIADFKKIVSEHFKGDHINVEPKLVVEDITTVDVSFHGDKGMVKISEMNKMISDIEKKFSIKESIIYASYEIYTRIQVLVFTFIVTRK